MRGCARAPATWWRRPTLPLGALHHLLGHALGAALLPLLLQQLLKLRPTGIDAPLVGGAGGQRLQRGRRWGHGALLDVSDGPIADLHTQSDGSRVHTLTCQQF